MPLVLSDGLAVDAGHVARRSGCRFAIDLELVPREGELDDLGMAWSCGCTLGHARVTSRCRAAK